MKTFTIGFWDSSRDEAPLAKAVAQHLGMDHSELYVTPQEALSVIPSLPEMYDEPFADSSAIPTFLVSRLARRHVTVSLSGDGGDELFGGYTHYREALRVWRGIRAIPRPGRRLLAGLIRLPPGPGVECPFPAATAPGLTRRVGPVPGRSHSQVCRAAVRAQSAGPPRLDDGLLARLLPAGPRRGLERGMHRAA